MAAACPRGETGAPARPRPRRPRSSGARGRAGRRGDDRTAERRCAGFRPGCRRRPRSPRRRDHARVGAEAATARRRRLRRAPGPPPRPPGTPRAGDGMRARRCGSSGRRPAAPSGPSCSPARRAQGGRNRTAIPASAPRGRSRVRFRRDFDHQGIQSGGFRDFESIFRLGGNCREQDDRLRNRSRTRGPQARRLRDQLSAPPQLLPCPAVQPKQWSRMAMGRPSTSAPRRSATWVRGDPFSRIGSPSIWLKSQS